MKLFTQHLTWYDYCTVPARSSLLLRSTREFIEPIWLKIASFLLQLLNSYISISMKHGRNCTINRTISPPYFNSHCTGPTPSHLSFNTIGTHIIQHVGHTVHTVSYLHTLLSPCPLTTHPHVSYYSPFRPRHITLSPHTFHCLDLRSLYSTRSSVHRST